MAYGVFLPGRPSSRLSRAGLVRSGLDLLFEFGRDATSSRTNLVNGMAYGGSGTGTYGVDRFGPYYESLTNATRFIASISLSETLTFANDYTILLTFTRAGDTPAWAGLFVLTDSGGNFIQAIQRNETFGSVRIWKNAGYATLTYNIATRPQLVREHTVVLTNDGTTSRLFFTGGGAPGTVAQTALSSFTTISFQVGGFPGAGGEYYPARYRAFARWSRAMPAGEAQMLADTHGLGRPPRPIIYSLAAPAPTLSAATVTEIGTTTARPRVTVTFS